jgi:hypothetical protein
VCVRKSEESHEDWVTNGRPSADSPSGYHSAEDCRTAAFAVVILIFNNSDKSRTKCEGLTVASVKMAVFWIVAPSSLVGVTDVSEMHAALMMEAACTSETSVNFYETARRYNPEDSHLHLYVLYSRLCCM